MRFDKLTEPVSAAEPCGPDFDELGDDKYLNYTLGAENRLPTRYLDFRESTDGIPFDPSTIDLKSEVKAIAELLEETRDLRLLTLDARFHALSGQLVAFCESVEAIAALLTERWVEVHPQGYEGDFTLRLNVVGALNDRATIISALDYAPVLRDSRAGPVTLRALAIAKGTVTAREGERTLDINQLNETLRAPAHRATVEAAHATIMSCQKALTAIQTAFDEQTNYEYSPNFDLLRGALGQLRALVEIGLPDIAAAPPAEDLAQEGDEEAVATGAAPVARMAAAAPLPAGSISSRAAAAALLAAETYFGKNEASSPALILVHQARQLVGRTLVAALEELLPETAENVTMVVDPGLGFEFSMSKMRAITEDYAANAEAPYEEEVAADEFQAETRQQAAALIVAASAYFRAAEPTSPIPVLLSKAERYLTLSFTAILADLMVKNTTE